MRVSALIATHNYGRFLGDAVRSVLAQDYAGGVECVVVDDGSTDATGEVLASFGSAVVSCRQENQGQAAAFNRAFELAKGDVLCFLDADDAWAPSKVRRVVEALRRQPEAGLVHHRLAFVDEAWSAVPPLLRGVRFAQGDVRREMRRRALPTDFWMCSGLCVRRSVARWVFPLCTGLKTQADGLVATSAALLAPVLLLEEELGSYRVHGSSAWSSVLLEERAGRRGALAVAQRRAPDIEERIRQGNEALRRAGLPGRLSPWLNWTYLKDVSLLQGGTPLSYLPRSLLAALRCRDLEFADRVSAAARLLRRAVRQRLRADGYP